MGSHRVGILASALCASVSVSCGVSFQFGGAPPPVRVADPVQRCVALERVVTRPAWASFTDRRSGGPNVTIVTTYTGRGLTFYQGQQRLTAAQALTLLGDNSLKRAYEGLYKSTLASGRSMVNAGAWLIGIGAISLVVGGALIGASVRKIGQGSSDRGLLWAGVGVMSLGALLGTISGFVFRAGIRKRNFGEAYRTIFIPSGMGRRLVAAVRTYNRRVAARCGGRRAPTPAPSTPAPTPTPRTADPPEESF